MGVVQVQSDSIQRLDLPHCLEKRIDLLGMRNSQCLTQIKFVHADGEQTPADVHHRRRRDRSLVWTCDHAAHVATHGNSGLVRTLDDRDETFDRFRDGRLDVVTDEGFARGGEDGHLVGGSRQRAVESPAVRYESGIAHAIATLDA